MEATDDKAVRLTIRLERELHDKILSVPLSVFMEKLNLNRKVIFSNNELLNGLIKYALKDF